MDVSPQKRRRATELMRFTPGQTQFELLLRLNVETEGDGEAIREHACPIETLIGVAA